MESMNDRQMALMEQMHSTLRSVERRMEETKYLDGRQVALLRSIDRRMEERNEGLKCFRGNDGKRSCYKFVQVKMTRDGARTYCRNIGDGVDLVSIESQQHTNFLSSVIKGLPATCALYHTSGEKKSGVWQWTATGQPFNYIVRVDGAGYQPSDSTMDSTMDASHAGSTIVYSSWATIKYVVNASPVVPSASSSFHS
ncbi:hypothetical protein LSAT2_017773 [Lamellibrachia satsuma]|nr:hypothetical protein LSAT2_017773 [Lamellibrachia satsuma]